MFKKDIELTTEVCTDADNALSLVIGGLHRLLYVPRWQLGDVEE